MLPPKSNDLYDLSSWCACKGESVRRESRGCPVAGRHAVGAKDVCRAAQPQQSPRRRVRQAGKQPPRKLYFPTSVQPQTIIFFRFISSQQVILVGEYQGDGGLILNLNNHCASPRRKLVPCEVLARKSRRFPFCPKQWTRSIHFSEHRASLSRAWKTTTA